MLSTVPAKRCIIWSSYGCHMEVMLSTAPAKRCIIWRSYGCHMEVICRAPHLSSGPPCSLKL